jgi:hypothetical protein
MRLDCKLFSSSSTYLHMQLILDNPNKILLRLTLNHTEMIHGIPYRTEWVYASMTWLLRHGDLLPTFRMCPSGQPRPLPHLGRPRWPPGACLELRFLPCPWSLSSAAAAFHSAAGHRSERGHHLCGALRQPAGGEAPECRNTSWRCEGLDGWRGDGEAATVRLDRRGRLREEPGRDGCEISFLRGRKEFFLINMYWLSIASWYD